MTTQKIILALGIVLTLGCAKPEEDADANTVGSYIVVLNRGRVDAAATAIENAHQISLGQHHVVSAILSDVSLQHDLPGAEKVFSVALQGGVYEITGTQAAKLAQDPNVAYVEKDRPIHLNQVQDNAVQTAPPWGLDRLDQNSLPLNQSYSYSNMASGVNVYIIDTGILTTHQEFGGRAHSGYDFVDQDNDATDCNGHGTHVSGTIGSVAYGVAKGVQLYAVRVLDCAGSGSYSSVIAGIEWVTSHHVKPAVANMSLGGGVSQAIDDAVNASIHAGVTYVVAAGNENTAACNSSPARVAEAITVGSTTSTDGRSSFSNYGSCVTLFAPGSDIKSTWYNSPTATNTISGTSMASPHAAGVAALYLAAHPAAQPSEVKQALVSGSLSGKISNPGSGSPNLLLNTLFLASAGGSEPPSPPPPSQPPSAITLQNGVELKSLSAAVSNEQIYTIAVPTNSAALSLSLYNGQGDADLYVRYGSKPTTSSYDCKSVENGPNENCLFESPAAGTWYVLVHAYTSYNGVTLIGSYQKNPVATDPCSNCTKSSGSLSAKGQYVYVPDINGTSLKSGMQQIWLEGPRGADFDLYLYKKSGSSWQQVASSAQMQSSEKISYNGSAGVYRVKIVSYSGSGDFKLWLQTP